MDRDLYLEFGNDDLPIERGVYPMEVPGGFVNLSGVPVPCEVSIILSYGPNFIPPHIPSTMDIVGMMARLYEDCIRSGGTDVGGMYYREIYYYYKSCFDESIISYPPSFNDRIIGHMLSTLVQFLDADPGLIVAQADKGRCTVLMNLHEYNSRMENWVQKCERLHIYTCISEDKVKGLMRGIESSYKRIYNMFIEEHTVMPKPIQLLFSKVLKGFDRLNRGDGVRIPYLYGTIKRHKEGYPIRPICASLFWWAQPIQKALVVCLKRACSSLLLEANVTGGVESAKLIHLNPPPEGYVYVKLDITDMYTSMPSYKIIGVIKGWLRNPVFAKKCILSRNLLLSMLHFSIEFSTYLTCDGLVYKQIKGLPQGASDSGLLATIYLDWLLGIHYFSIFFANDVKFWLKYVDDFLILLPAKNVSRFRDAFEHFTGLTVTLEYEAETSNGMYLSFLDVDIWRCGGHISTGIHRKPIASMRTIHYMSAHSSLHKRNTLREYIRKVLMISSNELLNRDLGYVVRVFEVNSYPYEYIAVQMRFIICAEIGRLKIEQKTFCQLNIANRIEIIYTFLLSFSPYISLPSIWQCYALSAKIDKKTRCVPVPPLRVMSFRYDALSSIIRKLYKFNGFIGSPIFSIKDHNLSRMLRLSLSGVDPAYGAMKSEKIFLLLCANCNYTIIVSSKLNAHDLLEESMNDPLFPLRLHCDATNHQYQVRAIALHTANDRQIGLQITLYRSIYELMGFECYSTGALMELPRLLKRFLNGIKVREGNFPLPLLSSRKVDKNRQISYRTVNQAVDQPSIAPLPIDVPTPNQKRSKPQNCLPPSKRSCP